MAKSARQRERQRQLNAERQRQEANARKRQLTAGQRELRPVAANPGDPPDTYVWVGGVREASDNPAGSTEPPKPPPVFSQCVVGYRMWSWIDALGRLRPAARDTAPWTPGINTAKCERHSYNTNATNCLKPDASVDHQAPAGDCTCGLYARFSVSEVPPIQYDLAAARVAVGGPSRHGVTSGSIRMGCARRRCA